ncbi:MULTISPECIES: SAM-dependent methyltransferase [Pseudonocardia]|uniref:Cypemycin methyltransferase n=2 Tax=Pseudonocardia TaxID=1847 RepID=A0A1Y2MQV4_PSEAH|nr:MULTISPECIES: class I SAM-dependent methyltransferase [Pseudonocardia]OSY37615.1 Cypemycin methyltransferase [Pseudonocardia autotrophica]TDN73736.1 methyltransferase family protein [Pseudonocardia autotrophica]BBG04480.1 hypothetical protein Pdca_56890 [Pseudonocardia autotrophica]GEC28236.1 hypothetical protein PSA01_52650 [Pseudonocardia saturnea]
MHTFDKAYWEKHWAPAAEAGGRSLPVSPYLPAETRRLTVGTALDAGCGTGTEALWLAEQGWRVTGADISATALSAAADRAEQAGLAGRVDWIEADLTGWAPGRTWDLVVTSYAHPDSGQLAFYRRIGSWVAPGGTLLVIGHLHGGHGHHHPGEATADRTGIAALFTEPEWRIDAGYETTRTVHPGGRPVELHDVVVRAHRNP